MNLSKPTVKTLQREMGVPPRFPVANRTKRLPRQNKFAAELVNEVAQAFFGGEVPAGTGQLGKIMTSFPPNVPDKLKGKMDEEEWREYCAHLTSGILTEIRTRENRRHVN